MVSRVAHFFSTILKSPNVRPESAEAEAVADTTKASPLNIFKPNPMEELHELLHKAEGRTEEPDKESEQFNQFCTHVITRLLWKSSSSHDQIFNTFIREIGERIQAEPKLEDSFLSFLFQQLSEGEAAITDRNLLAAKVALKSSKHASDLLQVLMTNEPDKHILTAKFIEICRQNKLIGVPDIECLIRDYSKKKNDDAVAAILISNLIQASQNPDSIKLTLKAMLMGETKIFNKTNAELIEACQQQEPEELDDDGDTTTLKEEAPDPGILDLFRNLNYPIHNYRFLLLG